MSVERKLICEFCGNEYIARGYNQKFCSKPCYYKEKWRSHDKEDKQTHCKNCNKLFNLRKTSKYNIFCSLKCNYEYKHRGKMQVCEYCKTVFVKKNSSNRFCCREHYFKSAMNRETSLEKELYSFLEKHKYVFEKQKQILKCIPDAYISEGKICVFADGVYWHTKPNVEERDKKINRRLKKGGYRVLRIGELSNRKLDISKLKLGLEVSNVG